MRPLARHSFALEQNPWSFCDSSFRRQPTGACMAHGPGGSRAPRWRLRIGGPLPNPAAIGQRANSFSRDADLKTWTAATLAPQRRS